LSAGDSPVVATVVVPTYNRSALLRSCLRSLVDQQLEVPYEVVVVDDGSTDDTRLVVDQARRSRGGAVIRYHWQPNAGINAGRNKGIALARSDLVCFVDDDVDAPPHWLSAIVDGASRHPEATVLGGPIRLRIEGRPPRMCGREQLPETVLDLGPQPVWDALLYGANFAVRREAGQALGGFDDGRGSGWVWGDEEEFERRVLASGGHTLYLPEADVWHRRTAADLRARSLLRKEFARGRTQAQFGYLTGSPPRVQAEVSLALRGVYHAVRRRCFTGALLCARAAGHCAGMGVRRGRSARARPAVGQPSQPGSDPR